ncbi:hypothetical protein [Bifidobacterium oedipodis]|uniref:Uncharacterized protein n=1 Tax=Bifidobacterium oedipodis TaxID=2675322 RepID=A0A7Y0EPA3_9BIFI|nr:hypothetical protein [Bifidobacterium sp. DSM 109957]NMM93944.1 hypothetical protein [Bifidobacterium sp. DSM 109957]
MSDNVTEFKFNAEVACVPFVIKVKPSGTETIIQIDSYGINDTLMGRPMASIDMKVDAAERLHELLGRAIEKARRP